MKTYKSVEMIRAYNLAGYRERYAMEHGTRSIIYINGEKCFKFNYSKHNDYQDANGATYNVARRAWVN